MVGPGGTGDTVKVRLPVRAPGRRGRRQGGNGLCRGSTRAPAPPPPFGPEIARSGEPSGRLAQGRHGTRAEAACERRKRGPGAAWTAPPTAPADSVGDREGMRRGSRPAALHRVRHDDQQGLTCVVARSPLLAPSRALRKTRAARRPGMPVARGPAVDGGRRRLRPTASASCTSAAGRAASRAGAEAENGGAACASPDHGPAGLLEGRPRRVGQVGRAAPGASFARSGPGSEAEAANTTTRRSPLPAAGQKASRVPRMNTLARSLSCVPLLGWLSRSTPRSEITWRTYSATRSRPGAMR